jgi:outer membrane protein assembly factor BamB
MVFTAGGWGGRESIKAFEISGRGSGKMVWEQRKGMPKVPSMLFVAPYLFALTDSGMAFCLKAETGDVMWQQRLGGSFSASPVSAEGRVYVVSDAGEATVFEMGPEFKIISKNSLEEKVQASAAISQGQLFIRTEKHLYAIGGK